MKQVAVVGEGVVGVSTALAIRRALPKSKLTLFSDRDFADTTSYGPAGIFRLDHPENRHWATATFEFWAKIERQNTPLETGVHLISGHCQSDDRAWLESQERCMADIVYNWHWLSERELGHLFERPSRFNLYTRIPSEIRIFSFGVHYSAYAAEARLYVPWLRAQLVSESAPGTLQFRREKLNSIQELVDSGQFAFVVNCAGLNGGQLAGDDDTVYPNRGVGLEVEAPGHGHFSYRDRNIFCIPIVTKSHLLVGTLREDNNWDRTVNEQDREHIWSRFTELQPNFKDAKIVSAWCGLRPNRRGGVRLEHQKRLCTKSNDRNEGTVHVIHNYGHASNGILLSWGCALEVADMIKKFPDEQKINGSHL